METYLTERRSDPYCGDYVEVWHVPPPNVGVKYRVTNETWNDTLTERHIWEYKVPLVAL